MVKETKTSKEKQYTILTYMVKVSTDLKAKNKIDMELSKNYNKVLQGLTYFGYDDLNDLPANMKDILLHTITVTEVLTLTDVSHQRELLSDFLNDTPYEDIELLSTQEIVDNYLVKRNCGITKVYDSF